jgi:hypothetical protein
MKIELIPGETVVIGLQETDGEITVSFSGLKKDHLTVHTNLPDSFGRGGYTGSNPTGVIYDENFEAGKSHKNLPPFMGLAEVCEFIGESKQTFTNWRENDKKMVPAPIAELAMGPVWSSADIYYWNENYVKLKKQRA